MNINLKCYIFVYHAAIVYFSLLDGLLEEAPELEYLGYLA